MSALSLVCRLLLVAVFVVSGVAKLADPAGSRDAARAFGVPGRLARPLAVLVPMAELAGAALLLAPSPAAAAGAVLLGLLLLVFTAALARSLVGGGRPDCHCFGPLTTGPSGVWTVARNFALLAAVGVVLLAPGALHRPGAGNGTAVVVLAAAVAVLVVAVGVLGARVRAVPPATGPVTGKHDEDAATGEPAPDLALPGLDGTDVVLSDLVTDGRPAVLVFTSAGCGWCAELLPELAGWAHAEAPAHLMVVGRGGRAGNAAELASHPGPVVALQDDREAAEAYGIVGTPAAVLVSADGVRLSDAGYGPDGVRGVWAAAAAPAHRRAAGSWPVDNADPVVDELPEGPRTYTRAPGLGHVTEGAGTTVTRFGTDERTALSATASRIWTLSVAGLDSHTVVRVLRAEYPSAPTTLAADVDATLAQLLAADLLRRSS